LYIIHSAYFLCSTIAEFSGASFFRLLFALQFPILLIIFYAIFHFTTFTLFMQISAKCYLNLTKRITVTRLSTPWLDTEHRYDYDSYRHTKVEGAGDAMLCRWKS